MTFKKNKGGVTLEDNENPLRLKEHYPNISHYTSTHLNQAHMLKLHMPRTYYHLSTNIKLENDHFNYT